MVDKILDACTIIAVFCFCIFCCCLDSAYPYDLLCAGGIVLALCELVLIIHLDGGLEW